jgi:hypothetical protein
MTIVNLHEYKNKLFSPYSDSVLPVFKITKDNFTHKGTEELKVDPLKIVTHTLSPFSKPISEKVWLALWGKMKIKVNY